MTVITFPVRSPIPRTLADLPAALLWARDLLVAVDAAASANLLDKDRLMDEAADILSNAAQVDTVDSVMDALDEAREYLMCGNILRTIGYLNETYEACLAAGAPDPEAEGTVS